MSGFAGVFNLDGAPVERAWLETMAEFLAFRGPDGSEIWVSGNVGLCHTLFHVAKETRGRPQIASLDDHLWIAGDVRVDDRDTLIAKLPGAVNELKTASSSELILHAYTAWGEACLDHLLGDFSFVIWDALRKRVLGARDRMGVKPFYYAQVGQCLLVTNTLDCIRQSSIVSSELNDNAVGDFLLVGANKNPTSTFFRAIQRLPAAYCLSAESSGLQVRRYWTLPIEEPIYFKRLDDYVERFNELLQLAVGDRLPEGPLGVLMSGGLDSPALAATAARLGADTTAFTSIFNELIPDEEGHYAGLVAKHVGIPIRYTESDNELWGWEPDAPIIHTVEPMPNPLALASHLQFHRDIAARARVFFVGNGPDASLVYEWRRYLEWLIKNRKWIQLGCNLLTDFLVSRRVPFLPRMLRVREERHTRDWYEPTFPEGFNKEFEIRTNLRERWNEIGHTVVLLHAIRPESYASFGGDFPMDGLDSFDAGFTRAASDFLQPFLDVRLLRFMLQVPAIPWCRDKYLVRRSLRGVIPESVRLRPKSPLAGLPYLEQVRRRSIPGLAASPELSRYVNANRRKEESMVDREEIDCELRILGLHYWLLGL